MSVEIGFSQAFEIMLSHPSFRRNINKFCTCELKIINEEVLGQYLFRFGNPAKDKTVQMEIQLDGVDRLVSCQQYQNNKFKFYIN
ncbi:hypothetical protein BKE30_15115 [Alkanindiges hydrocarboniclasticus]|uniref:Uncharacterized protein n=1 Tax=Alkanindiges hydrocarboniclasticus TaxID=1907941 RepID=A0A1S8CQ70_9GAMM|nr:hypothetical protein [Alkanindiges hydrocarboniclasticus]ONG37165.1 hypothetical protein BKE30_15115 [Alkanindiges hydrocarboniclasticus]